MRTHTVLVVLTGAIAFTPRTSAAQSAEEGTRTRQVVIEFNLAGKDQSLEEPRRFKSFFTAAAEIGSAAAVYPKPRATFLFADAGATYMFGRAGGVGVTVARTSHSSSVRLEAQIPDPILWNSPSSATNDRAVTSNQREVATHAYLALLAHRSDRLHVRLAIGPTFFRYSADMLNGFVYEHAGGSPTTRSTVTITGASTTRVRSHATGINLGGEATWFLTKGIGISTGVRFSHAVAEIDVEPFSKVAQRVQVGQTRGYLGLRFRFGR